MCSIATESCREEEEKVTIQIKPNTLLDRENMIGVVVKNNLEVLVDP